MAARCAGIDLYGSEAVPDLLCCLSNGSQTPECKRFMDSLRTHQSNAALRSAPAWSTARRILPLPLDDGIPC